MKDVDRLIQTACRNLKDAAVRTAASELIYEEGEPELADVVAGDETSLPLLKQTLALSKETGLPITLKLLWVAYAFLPRFERKEVPPAAPVPLRPPFPTPGRRSVPPLNEEEDQLPYVAPKEIPPWRVDRDHWKRTFDRVTWGSAEDHTAAVPLVMRQWGTYSDDSPLVITPSPTTTS